VALLGYIALILSLSTRPNLDSPVQFPLWDKVAHLCEYGLLGWLGTLAWATFSAGRKRWWRWSGLAFILAAGLLVGGIDELLQSQVQGRDASLADLASDGLGLGLGWGVARLGGRRRLPGAAGEKRR
jgi:VanZ family protein